MDLTGCVDVTNINIKKFEVWFRIFRQSLVVEGGKKFQTAGWPSG